nr:hypothetical protein [Tanacetum cinerariifolium]
MLGPTDAATGTLEIGHTCCWFIPLNDDIKAVDWSDNISPFWSAVTKSALTWGGEGVIAENTRQKSRGEML